MIVRSFNLASMLVFPFFLPDEGVESKLKIDLCPYAYYTIIIRNSLAPCLVYIPIDFTRALFFLHDVAAIEHRLLLIALLTVMATCTYIIWDLVLLHTRP